MRFSFLFEMTLQDLLRRESELQAQIQTLLQEIKLLEGTATTTTTIASITTESVSNALTALSSIASERRMEEEEEEEEEREKKQAGLDKDEQPPLPVALIPKQLLEAGYGVIETYGNNDGDDIGGQEFVGGGTKEEHGGASAKQGCWIT